MHSRTDMSGEEAVPEVDGCSVRMVDPRVVASVRAGLPPEGPVSELAELLGLLGDRSRLRLLMALRSAGELCVCDLAASTGMRESTVSHALRLLRAHRVVTVSRRGRMAFYRLDDAHIVELLDVALSHLDHGASGESSPVTVVRRG
jgi:DNA-binding transcriptional ArsR family regulator